MCRQVGLALSVDLARQDALVPAGEAGRIMRILLNLASLGRVPRDRRLHSQWTDKNCGAIWRLGTFAATDDMKHKRVRRGTPSSIRAGTALNTVFVVALLEGLYSKNSLSCEDLSLQALEAPP